MPSPSPPSPSPPPPPHACPPPPSSSLRVKEWYWIPHPSKVYVQIMIQSLEKYPIISCTTTDDEREASFEINTEEITPLPINNRIADDMISLPYLHEAGILHNLNERSKPQNQHPYTYVSTILVAINPLKVLPSPAMEFYKDRAINSNGPHPYGIAELAYKQMTLPRAHLRNQSIVISGESGAGKTETAKIVLRYLCWRAAAAGGILLPTAAKAEKSVSKAAKRHSIMGNLMGINYNKKSKEANVNLDKKLLDTNPILESFGNACTLRNANSSRFGKLMKLQFDPKRKFSLVAAGIETYLLEKSRVVSFTEGERNYHVFYQMLKGASNSERKRWKLRNIDQYEYLNCSSVIELPDVDDKTNYEILGHSLTSMGMNSVETDTIFQVLSAILNLGNTTFAEIEDDSTHESTDDGDFSTKGATTLISQPYLLQTVADLLGISVEFLYNMLLFRRLEMTRQSSSTYNIPLDTYQAAYARDAIAKMIYKIVFDWVVSRLCESLSALSNSDDDVSNSYPYIGVLDIFGFESFAVNGIEQLLINYANEALQLTFNKAVLVAEQQMYVEEGLQEIAISFSSNSDCVDLIARNKANSIFTTLDSICKGPAPTEEKFISTLHQLHAGNNVFVKPHLREIRTCFMIKHYAQTVKYSSGTFISKNMDSVPADLFYVLSSSTLSARCSLLSPTLLDLYVHSEPLENKRGSELMNLSLAEVGDDSPKNVASEYQQTLKMKSEIKHSKTRTQTQNRKKQTHVSVTAMFNKQMNDLCVQLESTNCLFIRCIKPNASMTPGSFDNKFVIDQVRVLGIVETCKVLQHGIPARLNFSDIFGMFREPLSEDVASFLSRMSEVEFIKAIMKIFEVPSSSYKLGKSKIFFHGEDINHMIRICSYQIQSGNNAETLSRKLISCRVRKWWASIIRYVKCSNKFLLLFQYCRLKAKSLRDIQSWWRKYMASEKRNRKKYICSLWRKAIYVTMCQNVFISNYLLIKEARELRTKAEEEAKRHMQSLLEEEEKQRESMMEARKLFRRMSSSDHDKHLSEESGKQAVDDALVTEPTTMREIVEMLKEQEHVKAKTEMQALVAASSLATVSVCLFRWTNIWKFAAFDKWHEATHGFEQLRVVKKSNQLVIRTVEYTTDSVEHPSVSTAPPVVELPPLVLAEKCYECESRKAMLICEGCRESYCGLCNKFVHESCRKMKIHIANKSVDETAVDLEPTAEDYDYFEGDVVPRGRRRSSISGMGFGRNHSYDRANACAIKTCKKEAVYGISIRFCEEHYEEFRNSIKDSSSSASSVAQTLGVTDSDERNTLQKQIALLKKQLEESGQQPVEFVELAIAREKMQAAVQRLMGGDEAAEKEIEKWDRAIRLNPEYQKEMQEKRRIWEETQRPLNFDCQRRMRCLLPLDIRQSTAKKLAQDGLPTALANRFWTKKILWFIVTHPEDIKKIHIVDLQSKYNPQGLDIVELRAVYASLPVEFDNDSDGKKQEWRNMIYSKLEEMTTKEVNNRLTGPEKRNTAYKGQDTLILFDPDIPLERTTIQKSSAFDAVELPAQVGSIKNVLTSYQKEKEEETQEQSTAKSPRIPGRLKNFLDQTSTNSDQAYSQHLLATHDAAGGASGSKEQQRGKQSSVRELRKQLSGQLFKRSSNVGNNLPATANPSTSSGHVSSASVIIAKQLARQFSNEFSKPAPDSPSGSRKSNGKAPKRQDSSSKFSRSASNEIETGVIYSRQVSKGMESAEANEGSLIDRLMDMHAENTGESADVEDTADAFSRDHDDDYLPSEVNMYSREGASYGKQANHMPSSIYKGRGATVLRGGGGRGRRGGAGGNR